jgi:hypothetical protein
LRAIDDVEVYSFETMAASPAVASFQKGWWRQADLQYLLLVPKILLPQKRGLEHLAIDA